MFLNPGFYFIILNDLSEMFLPIFRAYQGSFAPSSTSDRGPMASNPDPAFNSMSMKTESILLTIDFEVNC